MKGTNKVTERMTIRQAAALYNVSWQRIDRLVREGRLACEVADDPRYTRYVTREAVKVALEKNGRKPGRPWGSRRKTG